MKTVLFALFILSCGKKNTDTEVSKWETVQPILEKSCNVCHKEQFKQEVSFKTPLVKDVITSQKMPPKKPDKVQITILERNQLLDLFN